MNNTIIRTNGLVKKYRRYKKKEGIRGSIASLWKRDYEEKIAVNQIDLSVREGEFIGLIGPNGAGKTTLIKMLTGIIAPTEGSIDVLGYYPNDLKNAFKKQYAVVMGQKSQLFFELNVNYTLRLFQELFCGAFWGSGADGCSGENFVIRRKNENGAYCFLDS